MEDFKKLNNLVGWAAFLISFIVYAITAEETASFWDCGEFIAVSYKLEVPHPPGAPLFLLLGRMFSFLAMGDVLKVAYWINMLSVVSSALTILFLYWTIVLLGKQVIQAAKGGVLSGTQQFTLIAGGFVGAMAYTFSDSFWFSAVEAEVYGLSSFLTAFVFWAILKWATIEDQRFADKWLIMIAYTVGLSIGVHLLNLVTIPALTLLFYFRNYKTHTFWGGVLAIVAGVFIVGFVNSFIITGLPSLAGWFEIFFVNSIGLPFGSGLIVFILALIGGLVYGIRFTHLQGKEILNTLLLAFSFILIGYSSYGIIVIRSNYNTPIDENNPEDIISFVRYLKREQYGDRPLLYGPSFMSKRTDVKRGAPIYRKAENGYEIYDYRTEAEYEPGSEMLLPRMYSQQEGHPDLYRSWTTLGENQRPTLLHNLQYMFTYQFGHMYFRYFLWNFAGRESDDKEAGFLLPWEDAVAKGKLPEELAKNKARDNFYMIPLLLGMIGLFFHFNKDTKNFLAVGLLFLFTGLALVVYLNSPPVEPRERDYIYVGSFYAFAIWIGFGVFALQDLFAKMGKASPAVALALGLAAPVLMGVKGWDNHNRSNRFHSVDQARNTLASCAPNAILFTGGDNDTFPLWYVQEVEGFRTDVRVVVLSYFSTDWYIEQMRRPAYESNPLPISMKFENYLQGKNDWAPVIEDERMKNNALNVKSFIKFINENDPRLQVQLTDGSFTAKLPSRFFSLDVDKASVLAKGFIPKGKEDRVVDKMVWQVREGAGAIYKSDIAMLDILATNDWERPIYFNNTSANTTSLDLRPYLQLEGMTYRLMPIRAEANGDVGEVNTEVMKENMKKFAFRGFDDPNVYHDEEYRKFGSNTRSAYNRLARALYEEGKKEEAKEWLDEGLKNIPDKSIPYSFFAVYFAEMYYILGETQRADEIADTLYTRSVEMLDYLDQNKKRGVLYNDYRRNSSIFISQLAYIYRRLVERQQLEVAQLENQLRLLDESTDQVKVNEAKALLDHYTEKYRRVAEVMERLQ